MFLKFLPLTVLIFSFAFITIAYPALAQDSWSDKERFQLRLRGIGVLAEGSGDVIPGGAGTDVDNSIAPELDVTYFFTDHIAAELIAATAEHTVDAGANKLGDVWILPPTLTLQYHFTPDRKFSPYIGAGLNYSIFYGEDENGAAGITDLDVDNGLGFAAQIGADYWLNDHWGLNIDVKYIDLDVDVSVATGTVRADDVDIDPVIVGAGISYRF